MSPWEVLWIALGWLGVIAVVLIAAIIVFLLAVQGYVQAKKALNEARKNQ